jgi:hypothetical protein
MSPCRLWTVDGWTIVWTADRRIVVAWGGAQQAVALLAHYGFHLRVAFEALRHRAHRVSRAVSGERRAAP